MRSIRFLLALTGFIAPIFIVPGSAQANLLGPYNFWECLIDEMQGVKSDRIANDGYQWCQRNFPEGEATEADGGGLFAPESSEECVLQYGKDINSTQAENYLRNACSRLYPMLPETEGENTRSN